MKLTTGLPITGMRGTTNNSQMTFTTINGEVYGRAKVTPRNPQSVEQQRVRAFLSEITKNWDNLSDTQREAWEFYALQHLLVRPRANSSAGMSGYIVANSNRRLLDLPLLSAAPVEAPPAALQLVQQLGAQNPNSVGLTLTHSHAVTTGLVVLVRMTPATATVARDPQRTNLRFVRGATAQSSVALPASGGDVTFTPTRFIVNDGQRYGVEVRIVRTADGVPSLATFADFRKSV